MRIKILVLVLALFVTPATLACNLYGKVGAGYKIVEADTVEFDDGTSIKADFGHPVTARFELGCRLNKYWTFGVSHDSQWLSGAPFNDDKEYHKTEAFVDVEIPLGRIKLPRWLGGQ